ncbi:hypothetical protein D3845_01195 [Streptococcus mutans]|nr:hypothetical protein [Streptococcus mutans]
MYHDVIKKISLTIARLSTLESSQCIAHTLDAFKKQALDFSASKLIKIVGSMKNERLIRF